MCGSYKTWSPNHPRFLSWQSFSWTSSSAMVDSRDLDIWATTWIFGDLRMDDVWEKKMQTNSLGFLNKNGIRCFFFVVFCLFWLGWGEEGIWGTLRCERSISNTFCCDFPFFLHLQPSLCSTCGLQQVLAIWFQLVGHCTARALMASTKTSACHC